MTEIEHQNEQDHPVWGSPDGTVFQMLRRLQEHSRSNVPAMMAQRSMNSFTLHEEPIPKEARDVVYVTVYPQNPFISEPEVRQMSAEDIRAGFVNSRVRVDDGRGAIAEPDEDGNYLFWPGMPQFDQVSAFYYTTFTLRMYERYAKRAIPWAFPSARITVNPFVGNRANAYYDEQNQVIGFHSFLSNGDEMSTARSADIVSHEAGHAVLDGLRDFYNESFGLGPSAFHESFADITAVLVALHDESLIRRLLEWTKGDLRMSSFVSEVAEHLHEQTKEEQQHRRDHTMYLRNVFNQFAETHFDEMLYTHPQPQTNLSREPHNYSRVFSGAFYDAMVEVYEEINDTMPAYIALHRARDILGYLLMTAIEAGPVGEVNFADMAKSFLSADDVLYNGRHQQLLMNVFDARGILSLDDGKTHLASLRDLPDIRLPDTINTWLAAAQFLEDSVLPVLELHGNPNLSPVATYRNQDGNVFITYFSSEKILLSGSQYGQYHGSSVDAFGGLTLMFDSDNRLRNVCYRPVTDEDKRQIRIMVADYIEAGVVVSGLLPTGIASLKRPPVALWVSEAPLSISDTSESKLVKYPVIFDEIPTQALTFDDYLQAWGDTD